MRATRPLPLKSWHKVGIASPRLIKGSIVIVRSWKNPSILSGNDSLSFVYFPIAYPRSLMMRLHTQGSTVFEAFAALLLLLAPALSGVAAQSGAPSDVPNPFIFYNATLEIGSTGYVSWDLNSFSGPINLWVRENYPNASRPHIPLSCKQASVSLDLNLTERQSGQHRWVYALGTLYVTTKYHNHCPPSVTDCPQPPKLTLTVDSTTSKYSRLVMKELSISLTRGRLSVRNARTRVPQRRPQQARARYLTASI